MLWVKVISVICLFRVISGHQILQVKKQDNKIPCFVSDLIKDLSSRDSATLDVVLLNIGLYKESKKKVDDIYESLINVISNDNIITTPNLNEISKRRDMRKPAVMIIVSDVFHPRVLFRYLKNAEQSQYWNINAKVVFISTRIGRSYLVNISTFFFIKGLLNTIIIGQSQEELKMFSFNPYEDKAEKQFYKISLDNMSSAGDVFPDKLKDLKGYKYRVIFYEEFPNIFVKNKDKFVIAGKGKRFLETVAEHQNASVGFKYLRSSNMKARKKQFIDAFNNYQVDLSLNTGMMIHEKQAGVIKFVNTFETDGFCAMLPHPERKSFFDYFMKPYDMWTWILIMASLASFVVVWHFLNKYTPIANPNSAGYFLFAFVTFFIGQGVEFREHRLIQKVLIQLMIMMTFILGNAYQSVLISLMAESRYGAQITTIQGMIDSNFTFQVDPMFMKMFNESEQHKELGKKITDTVKSINRLNFKELSTQKVGLILTCNNIDTLYHDTSNLYNFDQNAIDYYYRMNDKFYSFYQRFPIAPYSPFVDRLQDHSLRIHESGVKQHWQTLLNFEDMTAVKERRDNANEEYLLNLVDMAGAFYCLGIGYALALIAFLLEIFYNDFMQRLTWDMVTGPIRRRLRRWVMRNRVAPHRFIQVQSRV